MSETSIFSIASLGMAAQTARLTTTASNMSNADNTASRPEEVYKSRHPVFQAVNAEAFGNLDPNNVGVKLEKIIEDERAPQKLYEPGNQLADENGYVYKTNVNILEEMVDMMSASRSYQFNAEVFNAAKQMTMQALQALKEL